MKRTKPTTKQQQEAENHLKDGHWEGKNKRAGAGRPPKFETAEELWDVCCEYFEWVENNPMYEAKLMQHKSETWWEYIPKKRPMSQQGLCRFLEISTVNWWQFKNERSEEFARVADMVENVIYEQQFSGGAVGFFNSQMISKKIGLKEQHELGGPDGGPIRTQEVKLDSLTDEELQTILKAKPELINQGSGE